jgi:ABC-type transporter Mla maintaining outer membrane lipid asymmetry permease subunit MlaE
LVTPRVIASIAMVPVLTILCVFIRVMGGLFVNRSILGISPTLYLTSSCMN